MRECRIWPCTSLGFAPASTIHVALEVRRQRQFTNPGFTARAAGLMWRDRMLLSRMGAPFFTDWNAKSSGFEDFTTRYSRLARPALTMTVSSFGRWMRLITSRSAPMVALLASLLGGPAPSTVALIY